MHGRCGEVSHLIDRMGLGGVEGGFAEALSGEFCLEGVNGSVESMLEAGELRDGHGRARYWVG